MNRQNKRKRRVVVALFVFYDVMQPGYTLFNLSRGAARHEQRKFHLGYLYKLSFGGTSKTPEILHQRTVYLTRKGVLHFTIKIPNWVVSKDFKKANIQVEVQALLI